MVGHALEPVAIKGLELRNRFIVAAAVDNRTGRGGAITPAHLDWYRALAKGGAGLIITGAVAVMDEGKMNADAPNLAREKAVEEYSALTKKVHDEGGKVAMQLAHAGIWAAKYLNGLRREAMAASVTTKDSAYRHRGPMPAPGQYHAATLDELKAIISAFADAAAKAKEAGFDAVEVHGAHDSLLAQFMSPLTNQREDEYGGSVENRCRLHRQIAEAIRAKVGEAYPLFLKFGFEDGAKNGLTREEGLEAGTMLAGYFDAIEVSCGLQGGPASETVFRPVPKDGSGLFHEISHALKQKTTIPVILTGGIRSLGRAEEILANNDADLIGMCRPFIRQPALVRHWLQGEIANATCTSCNSCVAAANKGQQLACQLDFAGLTIDPRR
jgi:2,4-dienoyl-CoA reductase-like NADH-dependent reductase (Old Yellow Enzyme family)